VGRSPRAQYYSDHGAVGGRVGCRSWQCLPFISPRADTQLESEFSRKTSLLNILAGRTKSRGVVAIRADVRLNNYPADPTNICVRKQIAFVAQENSLQVTSTPREAIHLSAKLRLPRETSEDALDKLTERMIVELGLTLCADTMVGGALVMGISGGERKRTSVGVELVVVSAFFLVYFSVHARGSPSL
jgi:ABC-type multidrug transport system ATPase subunit